MSGPKRMKPPPLDLGKFGAPPQADQGRPSFYAEESTMITALSEVERKRLATGESKAIEVTPPKDEASDAPSLSAPPPTGSPEAFAQTLPEGGPFTSAPALAPPASIAPPMRPPSSLSSLSSLGDKDEEPQPASMKFNLGANSAPEQDSEETSEVTAGQLQELEAKLHSSGEAELNYPMNAPTMRQGSLGNGVIVVFNARGGVGASTLAVNIAGSAHYYGQRVALVDLDLQLGALSSMLDGKPLERSLAELVMEASESTSGTIQSAIDERMGLSLIAQEGRIGEIGMVTPDRLPRLLDAVQAQHDLVIIDGVRSFSDHAVTAMDIADTILVVVTQDVPALRSARKVLSLAKRLGYDRGKVKLVLNRHQKRNALSVEEVEDRLDYPIFEVLPNDFKFVSSMIEQGCLARDLNLKHPVTAGFDRLTSQLLGVEPPKASGFFGKWFGKRSR